MEEYKLNKYRHKKIKDKYFITTDQQAHIFLDENEFKNLQDENIDESLFNKLEKEGIIITKKNQKDIISKTTQRYNFLFQGTTLHIIVPTLRCNMKCTYCQASSVDPSLNEFDMNEETAKKTVDFIFQSPAECITLEFQGGEPLLNFKIIKYINEYAEELNKTHKKNLKKVIVTNFNAIDEEKLEYLIKNDIGICTSLDGPKFIHDHNRPLVGGQGSYDNVNKWVKKINEIYKEQKIDKNVNALITVTKKTIDYPKEVVDEYINQNIRHMHLRSLTNLGCASKEWEQIGYTPEEFIEFWKKAFDYIIELNKKGEYIEERMAVIILKKILNLKDQSDFLDLRSPCGAAIGQLVYNHDGKIYTCDEGRMVGNDIFKIGTVDQKYKDVLSSKQTCSIVSSSVNDCFICDECVYKTYCGLCPVCNYFEQGSIIAKIPSTPRCKIYMAMFNHLIDKYFFDNESKKILDDWIFKKKC